MVLMGNGDGHDALIQNDRCKSVVNENCSRDFFWMAKKSGPGSY
jgi:hypothetical protein